jgi:hypothetical protein
MANYLYNGVKLPDINTVWTDKETYPYVCITYTRMYDAYHFRRSTSPIYFNGTGFVFSAHRYSYASGETWKGDINPNDDLLDDTSDMIWTNADILNEDGTVFLAASDPIPVPTYDPEALSQGYLVGCRIRAMRGKKPTEPDTPVEPDVPIAALRSADGYTLKDSNGIYITAKEAS